MLMAEVRAERLLRSIDAEVRESLTPAQLAAVRDAARFVNWDQHPVDLRLSLPLPFGRFFVALVAGRERRAAARRAVEGTHHPVMTPANLAFCVMFFALAAAAGFFLMTLLGGVLAY